MSFLNPAPVAVVLVPVDDGVLVVRRDIPPQKGALALPGGFIDHGESWQSAASRELREETGIAIDERHVTLLRLVSAPDGASLLVFCRVPKLTQEDMPTFVPTREVSERVLLTTPQDLAFPLHTEIVGDFFARRMIAGASS
jgi:ADP-ribose pyrophosphatase YjhB (NUDIX family)